MSLITAYSRKRDRGDLLLGELDYCIFCYLGVLHPPLLAPGEVFSLSVESLITVALEPVLARRPPSSVIFWFLSKMSYELFELYVTELKFLDRN